ncbi:LuxR C-terminal-related transcriptional regulator [Streptomyces sp. J2-1]|uniref:response regulator transcription factor n=1 Tax=Streptomyces corallincola TaxID=2851888 RepID=UPI001C383F62|nr:LuxR C-terminal-related transcriptional regulator [Streptomyces corallincola]MBV2354032.1 LuxR C-terminal-related transcriptional regulator [Streptomyces corallincola]
MTLTLTGPEAVMATVALPHTPAVAEAAPVEDAEGTRVARLRLRVLNARHADRVRAAARRAGLTCVPDVPGPHAVTVIVADDVERALCAAREGEPVLVVSETVTRAGLMRAVRAGALVLRTADLGAENLLAAVHGAGRPHQSIPYPVLSHLLTSGHRPADEAPEAAATTLTGRQTTVLRLMADGHANADIARLLSCSEHTVKNTVYELMSRLHARNRAHAVAHAVRHGLI